MILYSIEAVVIIGFARLNVSFYVLCSAYTEPFPINPVSAGLSADEDHGRTSEEEDGALEQSYDRQVSSKIQKKKDKKVCNRHGVSYQLFYFNTPFLEKMVCSLVVEKYVFLICIQGGRTVLINMFTAKHKIKLSVYYL